MMELPNTCNVARACNSTTLAAIFFLKLSPKTRLNATSIIEIGLLAHIRGQCISVALVKSLSVCCSVY